MKSIVLAGHSGLIGNIFLNKILSQSHYSKIILLGRSPVAMIDSRVIQHKVDFEKLSEFNLYELNIDRIDEAVCTLGSTIKKAGSRDAFAQVDRDFVFQFAKFAKNHGVIKFAVISSLGASRSSPFFYNRIKYEMEESLKTLNFFKLIILRPSLLIGYRAEKRLIEKIFIKSSSLINLILLGPLKPLRGIHANIVADIILRELSLESQGLRVIENDEMLDI